MAVVGTKSLIGFSSSYKQQVSKYTKVDDPMQWHINVGVPLFKA
jgi:hypothetical protein